MLELGAKPEEARSILPNSLKTEIVMTMNLREWRHFIRLRSANAAHPQMRQVSDLILKKFSEEYPLFFRDLAEKKENKNDDVQSISGKICRDRH